jgi:hypothetical protein
VTMLHQAGELQRRLQQQLAANGVAAPQLAAPQELGWDGSMPHPMAWAGAGADLETLRADAKKVRASAATARGWRVLCGCRKGCGMEVWLVLCISSCQSNTSTALCVLHSHPCAPGLTLHCSATGVHNSMPCSK